MLDSKEIAGRALLRAEKIKAWQKGKSRRRVKTLALMICTSAMTAAMFYMIKNRRAVI